MPETFTQVPQHKTVHEIDSKCGQIVCGEFASNYRCSHYIGENTTNSECSFEIKEFASP